MNANIEKAQDSGNIELKLRDDENKILQVNNAYSKIYPTMMMNQHHHRQRQVE